MKHLKTIKELFDSEEIKSENEIEYLKGEVLSGYQPLDMDETIEKLLYKIFRYNLPFIQAFVDIIEKGVRLKTIDLSISTPTGELDGYYFLRSSKGQKSVTFGIKPTDIGEYDTFLLWETNDDDTQGVEDNGLNYSDLISTMKIYYVKKLREFGFDELLNYGQVSDLN